MAPKCHLVERLLSVPCTRFEPSMLLDGQPEISNSSSSRDNDRMVRKPIDAVIIGGGPAGAVVARLLAHWGHTALLLTKRPEPRRSLGESLPPSARKLLDLVGASQAVENADCLTSTGNTVWWGDRTRRSERFADGATGLQVERHRFDTQLLAMAEGAGAQLRADAVVRDATLPPAHARPGTSPGTVRYSTSDGMSHAVETNFILDCSGRSGLIARRGYRVRDMARTTLALTGVWTRDSGWNVPDDTHTLVEAYDDGWAWSVPVSPTRRYVTVMVDPHLTDLDRSPEATTRYLAELSKTTALGPMLEGAVSEVPPWGCNASLYHARRYSAPGLLLVGDAGSFIDPISSYGVKKALASAWLAAVVVHTSLTDTSLAAAAAKLFNEREGEMHTALAIQSQRFFADVAEEHLHPFWTGRAAPDAPGTGDTPEGAAVDIDQLRHDRSVQAAFTDLRQSQKLHLELGAQAQLARRPAVTTHRIIMEDQLVVAGWTRQGRGIRFLREIDLVGLIELAPHHEHVPDLYEAYNQRHTPVNLSDFLGVLSVLIAKGALRHISSR